MHSSLTHLKGFEYICSQPLQGEGVNLGAHSCSEEKKIGCTMKKIYHMGSTMAYAMENEQIIG